MADIWLEDLSKSSKWSFDEYYEVDRLLGTAGYASDYASSRKDSDGQIAVNQINYSRQPGSPELTIAENEVSTSRIKICFKFWTFSSAIKPHTSLVERKYR